MKGINIKEKNFALHMKSWNNLPTETQSQCYDHKIKIDFRVYEHINPTTRWTYGQSGDTQG